MNNVELARTLSWRENALFEKRKRTFRSARHAMTGLLENCHVVPNELFEKREKNLQIKQRVNLWQNNLLLSKMEQL